MFILNPFTLYQILTFCISLFILWTRVSSFFSLKETLVSSAKIMYDKVEETFGKSFIYRTVARLLTLGALRIQVLFQMKLHYHKQHIVFFPLNNPISTVMADPSHRIKSLGKDLKPSVPWLLT